MRRAALAAALALAVLASPARAQVFPSPTRGDPPTMPLEHTLLDATIVMHPPDIDQLCMQIGPGRLTMTTRMVTGPADGPPRRTTLDLNGFMADPDARVAVLVTSNESTSTVQLAGAMYCWRLDVVDGSLPPNAAQMSMAERGAFIQSVAVRITLAPQ